jgi:hypothetical protein
MVGQLAHGTYVRSVREDRAMESNIQTVVAVVVAARSDMRHLGTPATYATTAFIAQS